MLKSLKVDNELYKDLKKKKNPLTYHRNFERISFNHTIFYPDQNNWIYKSLKIKFSTKNFR